MQSFTICRLRKGLASGIVISGIGSGVLFFAPVMDRMMKLFARLPEFVGTVTSLDIVIDQEGKIKR